MSKYYLRCKARLAGQMTLCLCLASACSNPGKPGPSETSDQSPPKVSADATPINPTQPDAPGTRIIINYKNSTTLRNLTGYVVGAINEHSFKALGEGRFAINALKTGLYDIILEAQRIGDDPAQSAAGLGLRINGVALRAGEDTTLRDIELLPYAQLKGKAHLLDGVTHGAIGIEIPGTRIKAATAADGSYTLEHVPSGWHDLTVINPGFITGIFDKQNWSPEVHDLPTLTLLPVGQAAPTGVHYRGDGLNATEATNITLFLVRPANMNSFRWSVVPDFTGASWQVFRSSIDMQLPAGGERRIFVQFAKDQQQLSAIFSTDIPAATP